MQVQITQALLVKSASLNYYLTLSLTVWKDTQSDSILCCYRFRGSAQDAVSAAHRRHGRYSDCRVAIDKTHVLRFLYPVLLRVLHDAQRGDPKVLDVKLSCYGDCISEVRRSFRTCELVLKWRDSVRGQRRRDWPTLTVAKGYILRFRSLCYEDARLQETVSAPDIYNSCG